MSMATTVRKPVAQFVPSASPSRSVRAQAGKSLGLKRMEIPSLLKIITSGLRWSSVDSFLHESGFSQQQLAQYLGVPLRTLARRKEAGGLDENESERLLRLSEIYDAALHLFSGDKADAREWLLSPVRGLNNARPIDYARTDFGAREVRNLIGRLEHGVFS
jgi:putative toxin-antitoxin system antitoxin component (TIGR02293 family)